MTAFGCETEGEYCHNIQRTYRPDRNSHAGRRASLWHNARIVRRRTTDSCEESMTDQPKPTPELDDAALAFAEQVFDSARSGDAERLGDLLGRGLPANIRNHNGDSLLMLASYHGHFDATRVLLERGADPQLRNNKGQTPLAGAAFKGDLEMVKLLIECGADVEGASPDGKTALMMAAMFNRTEIVEYLIEQGADPHAADVNGATPLAAAAMMGATDTQALLSRLNNR